MARWLVPSFWSKMATNTFCGFTCCLRLNSVFRHILGFKFLEERFAWFLVYAGTPVLSCRPNKHPAISLINALANSS
jgi:hypothetical protein